MQRVIRKRLAVYGLESVAIPNGAVLRGDPEQRARQMRQLKLDGLKPGMADLLVYGKGGRIGHIEVKCEGKYQQAEQRKVQQWLTEWGHLYAVCRSQEDVDETLQKWGWI